MVSTYMIPLSALSSLIVVTTSSFCQHGMHDIIYDTLTVASLRSISTERLSIRNFLWMIIIRVEILQRGNNVFLLCSTLAKHMMHPPNIPFWGFLQVLPSWILKKKRTSCIVEQLPMIVQGEMMLVGLPNIQYSTENTLIGWSDGRKYTNQLKIEMY